MKKRLLLLLATILLPVITFCQNEEAPQSIDQVIDGWFGYLTGWFVNLIFYQIQFSENVSVYWVLFPLILGAGYFTVYFKFINFTGFFTSINIVRGKYDDLETDHPIAVSESVFTDDGDNPDTIRVEGHTGEVSHFQALTAALSATVGL